MSGTALTRRGCCAFLLMASCVAQTPAAELRPSTTDTLASSTAAPLPLSAKASNGVNESAVRATAYFENDGTFAKPNHNTDRHYTAGAGLGVQWQAPWVRDVVGGIPSWDGEFAASRPGVSYAMGALVALEMYTPEDITASEPIYTDRPYAGWSYGGLLVQRSTHFVTRPVFEQFEFDSGTVGPSGYAGDVQRYIHQRYGQLSPNGWDNQVRDEVGADFKYLRRYRYDLRPAESEGGFGVQVLPEAGACLGTIHTNINAAAVLRAGWNLPDDFGPGSLQSPADFTARQPRAADLSWAGFARSLSGYCYLRPAGRMVLHDSTIEGSFFRDNRVVQDREVWVGELRAGVVISMLRCIEIGYSQTVTSKEFVGQEGTDAYGSWTLAFTRAW